MLNGMKKLLVFLCFGFFNFRAVLSQSVSPCDIETLAVTESNIYKLTDKEIKDFLLTFDYRCKNNIEYSEYSNELLFVVLENHTKSFIKIIRKEKKSLNLDKILSEIARPIHDSIDLNWILIKVDNIKSGGKLKRQIVENLKKAQNLIRVGMF